MPLSEWESCVFTVFRAHAKMFLDRVLFSYHVMKSEKSGRLEFLATQDDIVGEVTQGSRLDTSRIYSSIPSRGKRFYFCAEYSDWL